MILSKELLFSDGQNITGTGEAASTNIIDLGAVGTVLGAPTGRSQDIGKGRPIPIVIQLDADSGGTNETLDVDVEVDADTGFSNPTKVASAQQVGAASAGHRIKIFYLPEGTNERYLRLLYTLGGTSPDYTVTAGVALADSTAEKDDSALLN